MTTVQQAEQAGRLALPRHRALTAAGLGSMQRHPLLPDPALMVLGFQLATGSFLNVANLHGIATDAATSTRRHARHPGRRTA